MLYTAHAKVGGLPWKELFEPAIRAASQGFKVSARLAHVPRGGLAVSADDRDPRAVLAPDGETLQEGDLFKNPAYAKTLRRIADEGPRALYEGTIAAADRDGHAPGAAARAR